MRCSDYEELLSAYAGDELSRAQRDFIEQHLAVCADCRDTLAGFKNVRKRLGALSAMEQKPDIKGGVMSEINGIRTSRRTVNWLRPAVFTLSVVAVVAMLFVLQPWAGNNGYTTLLAKVQEASEKLETYSIESYSIYNGGIEGDEPVTRYIYTFNYMSPDLAYLKLDNKGKGYEAYFIGDYQYYRFTGDGYTRWNVTSMYNSLAGRIPGTQEVAFAWLAHLDEMEQLDDEVISGVPCMHYSGISKSVGSLIEIWIGKDDYLIRQISQTLHQTMRFINGVKEEIDEYSTSIQRYYNLNEDISIELPLDDSGNLPDGWTHDLLVKDEPRDPGVPLDEALAGITGDEDWSDPSVVESVFNMWASCAESMRFFNALPLEGQLALRDYISNIPFTMSIYNFNGAHYTYGVFYFDVNGIKAEVDLSAVRGSDVWVKDPDSIVNIWAETLLSNDPQAYFDSLPYEMQQEMESAFSIRGFIDQITHMILEATGLY